MLWDFLSIRLSEHGQFGHSEELQLGANSSFINAKRELLMRWDL